MGIIAVIGAAMFGAFLGFISYMILDRRCYLTDDDYKIINAKFEDVWKAVQETKYRVRQLEDAKKENGELLDIASVRPETKVLAWHPEKGWIEAYFWERCCGMAFVRPVNDPTGLGFFWTYMVRKVQ